MRTLAEVKHLLPRFVLEPDPTLYVQGTPLFLDFEATRHEGGPLNPDCKLLLSGWQLGWDGEFQYHVGDEFSDNPLMEALENCDFIVAHHAKYELQWLDRMGVDIAGWPVYDTMLAEYVIGGNRWKYKALSLDNTAIRHGAGRKHSLVKGLMDRGVCPSEIPMEWLIPYNKQDVVLMPRIMRSQLRKMEGTRLLPVVYSRCLLTPVLADIEKEGMQLDPARVASMYEAGVAKHADLTTQMNEIIGGINLNSPKQKAKMLYEDLGFDERKVKRRGAWETLKTATGLPLTDADTIAMLEGKTERQKAFLALFGATNDAGQLLSKYLNKFQKCCLEVGGLLTAQFNQNATATHRLSSTGRTYKTQFQNMMRTLKKLFRAKREGYLMAEADGAQLEFRVAAHMGRCPVALADVEADVDVHTYTATVLTNAGQPTDRQGAKEHTFKPLYGGQSGTPAEQTYYRDFREKYTGIGKMQERWIYSVLENKYLETEWGLRYYWPDTKMDRSGYITNTTSICNYPVQAFATAEIIPLSLVLMWHVLRRTTLRIHIVNTVHDSIIAEIHPDEVRAFHDLSRLALTEGAYYMVRKLYGIQLVVKLGCGIKIAEHWGDTKEETKYDADGSLYKEASNG